MFSFIYICTGWMIGGSSPGKAENFLPHHSVHTGSWAQTASYPVGNMSLPGGKAAVA
jgi:hypothetical protein